MGLAEPEAAEAAPEKPKDSEDAEVKEGLSILTEASFKKALGSGKQADIVFYVLTIMITCRVIRYNHCTVGKIKNRIKLKGEGGKYAS